MSNIDVGTVRPAAVIARLLAFCAAGWVGLLPAAHCEPLGIGQPAPEFTAMDSRGESLTLSQYRGRTVVLEWTNADCPYTRKHYSSGNMQALQELDSIATADAADIPAAEPYFKEAMLAVARGSAVAHPVTKPYGCSVKY